MGNSQRLFAITVPNPETEDPNAPPSYLAATVPGYVPNLEGLLNLETFKIDGISPGFLTGNVYKIRDDSGTKILSAQKVKSFFTRGEPYRDAFEVSDPAGKVVFKLIECDDMFHGPGLLLGYLSMEHEPLCPFRFKVHDKRGDVALDLQKEGHKYNMIHVKSGQLAGFFQKRNTNGTKGWIVKNLDLGLKVGIISAAVTICKEKHDRRD